MMIEKRHTVRKYLDKPLEVDLVSLLNARIEQNNKLYNLTFNLLQMNQMDFLVWLKLCRIIPYKTISFLQAKNVQV